MENVKDCYVRLARETLETYVKERKIIDTNKLTLPREMKEQRAGVFVSIKTKDGNLRGCIGTISPYTCNIAEEIVNNTVSAGTCDPRFIPVREHELENLVYSVDILKSPEEISSKTELDVNKYGVIVRKGGRSGLLLPNLEGVDTPDDQISIALRKAGIGKNENFKMERFEVIRHEEA